MYFIDRVTLFFVNNCNISIECRNFYTFLHPFHNFLHPEVNLTSHTMFINASAKEFTLMQLLAFHVHVSDLGFTSSIALYVYRWNVYILLTVPYKQFHEWTDGRRLDCYIISFSITDATLKI